MGKLTGKGRSIAYVTAFLVLAGRGSRYWGIVLLLGCAKIASKRAFSTLSFGHKSKTAFRSAKCSLREGRIEILRDGFLNADQIRDSRSLQYLKPEFSVRHYQAAMVVILTRET